MCSLLGLVSSSGPPRRAVAQQVGDACVTKEVCDGSRYVLPTHVGRARGTIAALRPPQEAALALLDAIEGRHHGAERQPVGRDAELEAARFSAQGDEHAGAGQLVENLREVVA